MKLSTHDEAILKKLDSATKIQDYLDTLPFNHEIHGETCRSAKGVLAHKEAHCLEGAMLACAALLYHKKPPYLLSLKVLEEDDHHVVTLYKVHGYWGAISKTNHAVLGFRDPIYKTVRELAMSYFHEYFLVKNGKKTLRSYSRPIRLTRFGTTWIDGDDNQFILAEALVDMPHTTIIPKGNEHYIRTATSLERKAASISHDGL